MSNPYLNEPAQIGGPPSEEGCSWGCWIALFFVVIIAIAIVLL